ncbi:MAG: 5'-deoxynucleotidase [bacterium]|nr:5'-deoxynucleotidase [bacterium]
MGNEFFAMMSRMKYIERWALMRNSRTENICEHSLEVAMIAHALAVISNKRLGNDIDANRLAVMAMYHDSTEIITGDMPTPVKYYNEEMKVAFKEVERVAANRLLSMLPEDLREEYQPVFEENEEDAYLWKLMKAADKISALIKCLEEKKAGNHEFINAEKTLRDSVEEMGLEEVTIFFKEFMPAYELTLDELNAL